MYVLVFDFCAQPGGWYHHIRNDGPTIMINFWSWGCPNNQLAVDFDASRPDRPDFKGQNCAKETEEIEKFIYGQTTAEV